MCGKFDAFSKKSLVGNPYPDEAKPVCWLYAASEPVRMRITVECIFLLINWSKLRYPNDRMVQDVDLRQQWPVVMLF